MTFRPSKNYTAKKTNNFNGSSMETFPVKILGYVSGVDGINSYIVGQNLQNEKKYLIKTRIQNKDNIDIINTKLNVPQKMRVNVGYFKAMWDYVVAQCTNQKTKETNTELAKSTFTENFLKMKTTAEPGALVLCQNAYLDYSIKPADLVDFADENLGINFKNKFNSIKKQIDGSFQPDFSVEKFNEFISSEELRNLSVLNVKSLKRLTREENEDKGKIVKTGFVRLDAPKEKEIKIEGKNIVKYDVITTFIDNQNAVEVKQGKELKSTILQVLNKLKQEGGLNGCGAFVRILIKDELNYIVSIYPHYVFSKKDENSQEWVLDTIENVADSIYTEFVNTFFNTPANEDGEIEGFCEEDLLNYPCDKVKEILKIEVVPVRTIKIPPYENGGVIDYLNAREFFNKTETNKADFDAVKDNRFFKMGLNENLFKIKNEEIPYGFVEGTLVFKTSPTYVSAFEEFYPRYFAGTPENAPETIKKYSGDPRFICCSRDLVHTNVITIDDVIKESRPNEYTPAKIWAETSVKENEVVEANNKKYYENKKINVAETETILEESSFDDDDDDNNFDEDLDKMNQILSSVNNQDDNQIINDD